MRLYVVGEGPSEEEFVKRVLQSHLHTFGVWVYPFTVQTSRDPSGRKHKGGGRWQRWKRDLQRLTGENPGHDVRFTTMFDLYGLPDDFPEYAAHWSDTNTVRRAEKLETAMKTNVGDWRVLPYLQRHEFEALVLAALEPLRELLDSEDRMGCEHLIADLAGSSPEDVDDDIETSPSHRLRKHIPGYQKTLHGPLALEEAGLAVLRQRCSRFSQWIAQLETLGQANQTP